MKEAFHNLSAILKTQDKQCLQGSNFETPTPTTAIQQFHDHPHATFIFLDVSLFPMLQPTIRPSSARVECSCQKRVKLKRLVKIWLKSLRIKELVDQKAPP